KVYDGNTTATLTSAGTLVGLVPGQSLGLSAGSARFDTKDAGTGKTVTVDGLALADGSGGRASNYVLASPTTTTTAAITPKTLTLAGLAAADKV
ncbi:YDG domain-containing protein, partial [Piscinibacter sakaiensis]